MNRKSKALVMVIFAAVILIAAVVTVITAAPRCEIKGAPTAQNAGNAVELKWASAKGAQKYEIEKLVDGNWVECASTDKPEYKDDSAVNGESCSYRVRAVSGKRQGKYKTAQCVFLKQPEINEFICGKRGIKIKWQKQNGADGYEIYRKLNDGGSIEKIAQVNGKTESYYDGGLTKGKTYIYYVCSVFGENKSSVEALPQSVRFDTPIEKISVRNSPSGARLKWSKYEAAVGYTLMRKVAGESGWTTVNDNISETSYTDTTCPYQKKVAYKVCANLGEGEKGAPSRSAVFYSVDPNKKMVALTFDDGPYTPVTNKILSACRKYNARVTFFVVGSRVDSYSNCVKAAVKQGCEIGTHSYSHRMFTSLSEGEIKEEVNSANRAVEKYTNVKVRTVRCPGGMIDDKVKRSVDYPMINWSVDTEDWKNRDSAKTFDNLKANVSDGSIVLMHDLYESTGNAADKIMDYLTSNGYQIVTVSEMLDAKGINPSGGCVYYNGRK